MNPIFENFPCFFPVTREFPGADRLDWHCVVSLKSGKADVDANNLGYVGSQPSVVRSAISSIPGGAQSAFVDLGCGKGRVLAIASEFEFTNITGIEIAANLVKVARRNAFSIGKSHPDHKPIVIVQGDASTPSLGNTAQAVLFISNSFGAPLVERLVKYLEQAIAETRRELFIIYYNPVQFALFDESPAFSRFSAERYFFTPEELAVAPFSNHHDSVIIYQSNNSQNYPALPSANRKVRITVPNLGAEVLLDRGDA